MECYFSWEEIKKMALYRSPFLPATMYKNTEHKIVPKPQLHAVLNEGIQFVQGK